MLNSSDRRWGKKEKTTFCLEQGRLHKLRAGGAVLVRRANCGIFLLT